MRSDVMLRLFHILFFRRLTGLSTATRWMLAALLLLALAVFGFMPHGADGAQLDFLTFDWSGYGLAAAMLLPGAANARQLKALDQDIRAGQWTRALTQARELANGAPFQPDILQRLAKCEAATGNTAAALRIIDKAIALQPGNAALLFERGEILQRQGEADTAIDSIQQALVRDGGNANYHRVLGERLLAARRLAEAKEALLRAQSLNGADPDCAFALGEALRELAEYEAAALQYQRCLKARPGVTAARIGLGYCLLQRGDVDAAFASFNAALRASRLPGRDDPATRTSRSQTTRFKLVHDIEQLDWLLQHGRIGAEHGATLAAYRDVLARLDAPETGAWLVNLSDAARQAIGPTYNRLWHEYSPARLAGGAINPALDRASVEADYARNLPGMTYFDNLLTPDALAEIRRFCLESTIWYHYMFSGGYLGALFEDGFNCPLVQQIAEELPRAFPAIFGDHKLLKIWAFKYDSRLSGINMHADFAAVNVNFWVTPDEANLDPDSGGLIVWDKEAPLDWDFARYNDDPAAMRDFLAREKARSFNVQNRQNRAVIFNSDLFHETAPFRFREGYENRRINITMLYGDRRTVHS